MSDGILARWSRRKRAVREAEALPREETTAPVVEAAHVPEPVNPEEADALAEAIARLPRLEDLTAQTDLTPFLRAGIPAALRNAALRRMWSVDPGIRDFVSEAREYAYDWNTPGGVPGLGPMLPTDDIKAMVERVMGGPPPRPALEDTEARDALADAPPVPSEAEETPEADAPVATREESLPAQHVEGPNLNPASDPTGTFQSPAIVSRLRRHGGALPT